MEKEGFKVNPCNICVANRNINGSQQTVTWHVNDVKVSHKTHQANMDFYLGSECT